jgi:hypothetical protein
MCAVLSIGTDEPFRKEYFYIIKLRRSLARCYGSVTRVRAVYTARQRTQHNYTTL